MSTRFGLEVGRRAVKLVRVDSTRKPDEPPRAVRAAIRDLEPQDGAAARAATVAAIAECAKELGATGAEVHVAVPRSEAVVKALTLPFGPPPEERQRLIRFQAAKDVPFELSEVVLAHGVVARDASGALEVVYAAARTQVMDGLRALVREAGLVPGTLEVSTQAAARAACLVEADASDSILVVIGALATDLVVLRASKVVFSRSASVGCDRDPKESGETETERWLERLTAEVVRSLRGYTNGSLAPGEGPKVLLLAGGGAKREGVLATLAAHLGIPGRVVDPLGGGSSPALLVARGLAEARAVPTIPLLDLAGKADARQAATTKRNTVVASAIGAVLLGAAGLGIHGAITDRKAHADELERDAKALKPRVDEIKKVIHEVDVAKAWELRKGRSLEVLLAVSRAIPKDDAYLTRFQWSEGHTILLAGRARDNQAHETLLRRLNRDAIVERATPDSVRRTEGKEGLEFAITAKLRELSGEKPK